MGKYSMFITLGALISSLLYLGLDQSYVRFYNDEPKENRVQLLRKCLKYPMIVTLVISAGLLVFYQPFSTMLIGEPSFLITVVFVIYLVGLVVDRFWLLKIRMVQKAGAFSALNVIRKLSYLLFGVALFFTLFGDSYWSLVLAVTLAEGVLVIGCRFVERGNWKAENKDIQTSMGELIKYGFPYIFSTTITLIFHSTDKLMLNVLSDYNQVGLYAGAQNIVNLLSQVQLVFTTFWMPVAFEHYSKNPDDKDFFVKINKIVSYGMLVIAVLVLCTKDIVILFLGKNYHDAVYVFPFLAFMPIMYTVSESTVMGINFMKKSTYHVWISLIGAVTNLIGNYFLITYFGAAGAAISTGLAYVVFFIMRTILSNKVYPVKFALGRFFISCGLVYVLAIFASFRDVDIWFILISVAVLAVISVLYRDTLKYLAQTALEILKKLKNRKSKDK